MGRSMPAGGVTAGPKSVSADNGQPAAVLQSMPVSCHFRGCKASLTSIVSGAITSEQPLPFLPLILTNITNISNVSSMSLPVRQSTFLQLCVSILRLLFDIRDRVCMLFELIFVCCIRGTEC